MRGQFQIFRRCLISSRGSEANENFATNCPFLRIIQCDKRPMYILPSFSFVNIPLLVELTFIHHLQTLSTQLFNAYKFVLFCFTLGHFKTRASEY